LASKGEGDNLFSLQEKFSLASKVFEAKYFYQNSKYLKYIFTVLVKIYVYNF